MNLHAIASGAVAAVNPFIPISIQVSMGSTTAADGTRVPIFAAAVVRQAQVQPLSYDDIKMMDGLNLQGTRRVIFINGRVDGLVRVLDKGGDLITVMGGVNSGVWLVALVSEQWSDWCKCICTLQNGI